MLPDNMWSVGLHPTFRAESKALPLSVHDKLLAYAELIERVRANARSSMGGFAERITSLQYERASL